MLTQYNVQTPIQLPTPVAHISVENLVYTYPKQKEPNINRINFTIEPGEIIGITGPSASGKTTLCKLLLGILIPTTGHVRLDNADISQWSNQDIGNHVGYLPQNIELISGTIRQNISRMQSEANDEQIIEAAQLASVHDTILQLPQGYDTQIGQNGSFLSAGQRQRIGLARAFYGSPAFIVLDEPNSNLDHNGDIALSKSLNYAKQKNITVVIISHRKSIFNAIDKLMVMQKEPLHYMMTKKQY